MRAAALLTLLLALIGVAWLWLEAEDERNACGGVTPLNMPPVSAGEAPPLWQAAVTNPGTMFDLEDRQTRYRYFGPENPNTEQVSFGGNSQEWSAGTARALCAHHNTSDLFECRVFQEGSRYAVLNFKRDHIVESDRDLISSHITLVQADGAHLEVFVTTADTRAVDVAECHVAEALFVLSGGT